MTIEPLRRPGHYQGQVAIEPVSPNRVREIVRLHDKGMTFDAIAKRLGGTRMNACALYNRWRDWARQQK